MNQKGFVGLVGLVLSVGIICLLAYLAYKNYFGKPAGMTQETQEAVQQAGIDTTSKATILQSVSSQMKSIEEMQVLQTEQAISGLKE